MYKKSVLLYPKVRFFDATIRQIIWLINNQGNTMQEYLLLFLHNFLSAQYVPENKEFSIQLNLY